MRESREARVGESSANLQRRHPAEGARARNVPTLVTPGKREEMAGRGRAAAACLTKIDHLRPVIIAAESGGDISGSAGVVGDFRVVLRGVRVHIYPISLRFSVLDCILAR